MSFYIPALNKTSALGVEGEYTGNVITADVLSSTALQGAIHLSSVLAAFKFYTTPGNVNDVFGDDANWIPMNKGVIDAGVDIIHGNVGTGDETMGPVVISEVLQTLATAVFGSPEAVDLFSNGDAIADAAGEAINACRLAVAAHTAPEPTLQIGNAMIAAHAARFAFSYGAVFAVNNYVINEGTYTVDATSAASTGTAASVSIVIGAGPSIVSMSVTSVGSGYVAGEPVAFVINDGDNPPATISIPTPNPVQLAMLMGTLDDSANGVSFPFETGDVIKVKYSIAPHLNQSNSAGSAVNPAIGTHHFYTEFEVVGNIIADWTDPN